MMNRFLKYVLVSNSVSITVIYEGALVCIKEAIPLHWISVRIRVHRIAFCNSANTILTLNLLFIHPNKKSGYNEFSLY